jgi:pyridoxine 5-phosphate synthase
VCLVPERRQEVTTEGGLNVRQGQTSLSRAVARLHSAGSLVSLFIDPAEDQVRASADVGAQYVELHTGRYANTRGAEQQTELRELARAAARAHALGLRVNAGHGLNYVNVKAVLALPHLDTLNIGHAIVSRAVFVGLRRAVTEMLEIMRG